MNFIITGKGTFSAGINTYTRNYFASYKRNGKIKISNILTGLTLLDNLNIYTITINNQPFTNIENLQKVLYNRSCNCDNLAEEKIKIFDGSFDETFE